MIRFITLFAMASLLAGCVTTGVKTAEDVERLPNMREVIATLAIELSSGLGRAIVANKIYHGENNKLLYATVDFIPYLGKGKSGVHMPVNGTARWCRANGLTPALFLDKRLPEKTKAYRCSGGQRDFIMYNATRWQAGYHVSYWLVMEKRPLVGETEFSQAAAELFAATWPEWEKKF